MRFNYAFSCVSFGTLPDTLSEKTYNPLFMTHTAMHRACDAFFVKVNSNSTLPLTFTTNSTPSLWKTTYSPSREGLSHPTSFLWFGPRFLMKRELTSVGWLTVNFLWLFSFSFHHRFGRWCNRKKEGERGCENLKKASAKTVQTTRETFRFGKLILVSGSNSNHLCSVNGPNA